MIELEASGILYRNLKPHLRARHALHPSLALFDDEIVAAFDVGEGPESWDYATYQARSQDGGATWTMPTVLTAPATLERGSYANQIVRIGRVGEAIVGLGARIHRDDPEEGFVSRETFGYAPTDLILIESRDRGATWSSPRVIEPPIVGPSFEVCHRVIALHDGRWLAPMSTWRGWDGSAPNGMKAIALVSHDQGKSWPEYIDVMDGSTRGVIHFESSMAQLADGRLIALAWALHEQSGQSEPVPYTLSDPAGTRFGEPRSTGILGQTTKLITLGDGRLLALSRRLDVPGLWAHLVRIEGDDWIEVAQAPVWQGSRNLAAGNATRGDDLSNLKCGFPSMVEMNDGAVLAAFWCQEDGLSVIRWARLRMTPNRK